MTISVDNNSGQIAEVIINETHLNHCKSCQQLIPKEETFKKLPYCNPCIKKEQNAMIHKKFSSNNKLAIVIVGLIALAITAFTVIIPIYEHGIKGFLSLPKSFTTIYNFPLPLLSLILIVFGVMIFMPIRYFQIVKSVKRKLPLH